MFIEVCTILFLKINSHVKKMDRKPSSTSLLLHSAGLSLHILLAAKVLSVSGKHKWITRNRLPCCLCIQKGTPSSFPQF